MFKVCELSLVDDYQIQEKIITFKNVNKFPIYLNVSIESPFSIKCMTTQYGCYFNGHPLNPNEILQVRYL